MRAYAACRISVPTVSPIVGTIAGVPVTVTGAEKVTLTSIVSPARYLPPACGTDVSATAVTAGAARTVTVTVSLAL